jgi:hypothetical protein
VRVKGKFEAGEKGEEEGLQGGVGPGPARAEVPHERNATVVGCIPDAALFMFLKP